MFICKNCHDKNKSSCVGLHGPKSRGPCERCGRTNVCYDCHFVTKVGKRKVVQSKARRVRTRPQFLVKESW